MHNLWLKLSIKVGYELGIGVAEKCIATPRIERFERLQELFLLFLEKAVFRVAGEARSLRNREVGRIEIDQVALPGLFQDKRKIAAVELVLLERPVDKEKILAIEYLRVVVFAERHVEAALGIDPVKPVEGSLVKINEASRPLDFRGRLRCPYFVVGCLGVRIKRQGKLGHQLENLVLDDFVGVDQVGVRVVQVGGSYLSHRLEPEKHCSAA